MKWKAFKVILRMASPLHSGWMKIGNVQRTRLYVTGRMMWGALTSRITCLMGQPSYSDIGDIVKKDLRTTYFYPCFDPEGNKPLLPLYGSSGLVYKSGNLDLGADIVERSLLTSYASTVIDQTSVSAEEGSLHETELISYRAIHTVRRNDFLVVAGSRVCLVGYVIESSDIPSEVKDRWRNALTEMYLGGERTYGFGRVFLEDTPLETSDIFGYRMSDETEAPTVTVALRKPVLAHAITDDITQGVAEPFLGRETDRETGRFGGNLSQVRVCWSPGSILSKDAIFRIAEFGLWKVIS